MNYLRIIIGVFIVSMLTNCGFPKKQDRYDSITIDSELSKASVFKELDSRKELFSALENIDTSIKRSSDVAYYYGETKLDSQYARFNNCRTFYFPKFHHDTLLINIRIGNGFGGRGFIVYYKNNKFYTEPYFQLT